MKRKTARLLTSFVVVAIVAAPLWLRWSIAGGVSGQVRADYCEGLALIAGWIRADRTSGELLDISRRIRKGLVLVTAEFPSMHEAEDRMQRVLDELPRPNFVWVETNRSGTASLKVEGPRERHQEIEELLAKRP